MIHEGWCVWHQDEDEVLRVVESFPTEDEAWALIYEMMSEAVEKNSWKVAEQKVIIKTEKGEVRLWVAEA